MPKRNLSERERFSDGLTYEDFSVPRPDVIKEYLDRYVIGQDDAKKVLSVAVYNHYKRLIFNSEHQGEGITIGKSNVLLEGPTGSGKTFMIQKIAELIGVPCHIANAKAFTEAGYVGEDVENCITGLLRAADRDVRKAEKGIVILDEVDKLRKFGDSMSLTRDVGGEGVQQSLLKIVEGSVVGVPPNGGRKHPDQQLTYVDTTNILFIGLGAFVGLDAIVQDRMGKRRIGFSDAIKSEEGYRYAARANQDDLRKFGLIPEFVGRFPVIVHVDELTEEDLVRILTDTNDSIVDQYKYLLGMDGINVSFSHDALIEVARQSKQLKTGARGLRSIMETVMLDIMYKAPTIPYGSKIEITLDTVRNATECQLGNVG